MHGDILFIAVAFFRFFILMFCFGLIWSDVGWISDYSLPLILSIDYFVNRWVIQWIDGLLSERMISVVLPRLTPGAPVAVPLARVSSRSYDLQERRRTGNMTGAEQAKYERIPTDETEAQTLASADLDGIKSESLKCLSNRVIN